MKKYFGNHNFIVKTKLKRKNIEKMFWKEILKRGFAKKNEREESLRKRFGKENDLQKQN